MAKYTYTIGTQVRIAHSNMVGTLVAKGFRGGNFMYSVNVEGKTYNVFQVENI